MCFLFIKIQIRIRKVPTKKSSKRRGTRSQDFTSKTFLIRSKFCQWDIRTALMATANMFKYTAGRSHSAISGAPSNIKTNLRRLACATLSFLRQKNWLSKTKKSAKFKTDIISMPNEPMMAFESGCRSNLQWPAVMWIPRGMPAGNRRVQYGRLLNE